MQLRHAQRHCSLAATDIYPANDAAGVSCLSQPQPISQFSFSMIVVCLESRDSRGMARHNASVMDIITVAALLQGRPILQVSVPICRGFSQRCFVALFLLLTVRGLFYHFRDEEVAGYTCPMCASGLIKQYITTYITVTGQSLLIQKLVAFAIFDACRVELSDHHVASHHCQLCKSKLYSQLQAFVHVEQARLVHGWTVPDGSFRNALDTVRGSREGAARPGLLLVALALFGVSVAALITNLRSDHLIITPTPTPAPAPAPDDPPRVSICVRICRATKTTLTITITINYDRWASSAVRLH